MLANKPSPNHRTLASVAFVPCAATIADRITIPVRVIRSMVAHILNRLKQ